MYKEFKDAAWEITSCVVYEDSLKRGHTTFVVSLKTKSGVDLSFPGKPTADPKVKHFYNQVNELTHTCQCGQGEFNFSVIITNCLNGFYN